MLRKFWKSDLQLEVISRKEAASTATGYAKQHAKQQLYIISKAFEAPVSEGQKEKVKQTAKKMAETNAD